MNDRQRNIIVPARRVAKFGTDHAADFVGVDPADVRALVLFTALGTDLGLADLYMKKRVQKEGEFHGKTLAEEMEEAAVMGILRQINEAASLIADVDEAAALSSGLPNPTAGLMESFRMPRRGSEESLRSAALAFADAAAPLTARFIELGLPADFIADLQARVAGLAAIGAEQDTDMDLVSGYVRALDPVVQRLKLTMRQLSLICRTKYRNDPLKLGEWEMASHIEPADGGSGDGDGGDSGGGSGDSGGGGDGGGSGSGSLSVLALDSLSYNSGDMSMLVTYASTGGETATSRTLIYRVEGSSEVRIPVVQPSQSVPLPGVSGKMTFWQVEVSDGTTTLLSTEQEYYVD